MMEKNWSIKYCQNNKTNGWYTISLLSIHNLKIIRYERYVYDISWWRVFSLKFLHKYNNLYKYICIKKYYLNLIVIEFCSFFFYPSLDTILYYFSILHAQKMKERKIKRKEKLRESEWSFKYLNLTLSNK